MELKCWFAVAYYYYFFREIEKEVKEKTYGCLLGVYKSSQS